MVIESHFRLLLWASKSKVSGPGIALTSSESKFPNPGILSGTDWHWVLLNQHCQYYWTQQHYCWNQNQYWPHSHWRHCPGVAVLHSGEVDQVNWWCQQHRWTDWEDWTDCQCTEIISQTSPCHGSTVGRVHVVVPVSRLPRTFPSLTGRNPSTPGRNITVAFLRTILTSSDNLINTVCPYKGRGVESEEVNIYKY